MNCCKFLHLRKKVKIVILFCLVITISSSVFFEQIDSNNITAQSLDIKKYIGISESEYKNYDGSDITIAVIDTGLTQSSTISKDRILYFKDFIENKTDSYDDNGHGTIITNIIGANGIIRGIVPEVKFVIIKAFDKYGESSEENICEALSWIKNSAEKYNIRIINLSAGIYPSQYNQFDPILIHTIFDMGINIVCAAGNINQQNQYDSILFPGTSEFAITVGSCKNNYTYNITDDTIASFSAKGRFIDHYYKPDLVTLGVNILSIEDNSVNTSTYSGTSTSCAIVTGVIALICEKYPEIRPKEVENILFKNCIELNDQKRIDQGHGELHIK